MNNIDVRLIDSFESWTAVTPQWKALLDQSESSSFFRTWEWLMSWAECYLDDSRTLYILACYKKEKIVGIAPFYLEKAKFGPFPLKELRFLGAPDSGSDYLDVITLEKHEEAVADSIYTYLTGEASDAWDQLFLTDIRTNSLFLLHFMDRLEASGKYAELTRHATCPMIHLPGSKQDLHAMISAEWRRNIKRNERLMHRKYDISLEWYQGFEIGDRLDDFFQLYEKTHDLSQKKLHDTLKQLTKQYTDYPPPLLLVFLLVDREPLAALLHFTHKNTLSAYLMSVDKKFDPKISLGSFLVGQSILKAIDENYSVYDFLKGTEKYKFHWATGIDSTIRIHFWQKKPAALCFALDRLSRCAFKLLMR